VKVSRDNLFDCTVDLVVGAGETPENAQLVADNLCKADSRGVTTHGTYLLNPIYQRVEAGLLSLPTALSVPVDTGAIAVVDGGNGLGMLAGKFAMDLATQRARDFGIGMVLIRNTNTVGSLAYYTEMIAKQGMFALMSCNAAPAMAPWGGAEPFLGTNPVAIGIYTGQDMVFCADMATSIVARGRIRQEARRGNPIPPEWSLDADGHQTTDPNQALLGTLLPMGGPKGSAIAMAVDILSGMISGARYAPHLLSFHATEGQTGVGVSLVVVDISKFLPLDEFKASMQAYILEMKAMKKASFASEIFLPGEIEYQRDLDSQKHGISLDDQAVKNLNNLLEKIGSDKRLSPLEA
jgi:LDH2 family malate/lactate/ureidoglycolate dehydrogenase